MRSFFISMVFAALPRQWWRRWRPESTVQLRYAACASGVVEVVAALPLLVLLYLHFMAAVPAEAAGSLAMSTGLFTLYSAAFVVYPPALVLEFFLVEGVMRAVTAAVVDEVLPSLVLVFVARGHSWLQKKRSDRALGPRVPDVVERVGDCVRILTCRSKADWRGSVTVAFEDELFEIEAEELGPPPLRFIYSLKPHPQGKVIRGLRRYEFVADRDPK